MKRFCCAQTFESNSKKAFICYEKSLVTPLAASLLLALSACALPDLSDTLDASAPVDDADVLIPNPSDVALVDVAVLDVQKLDAALPDAALVDAALPDAALPDAALPDAALPDAAINFPDVRPPDAALPDAALPDVQNPDVRPPPLTISYQSREMQIPQFLPALIRISAQDLDALGGDPNALTFSVQGNTLPYEFDSQSQNAAALFWVRLPEAQNGLVVDVTQGGSPAPIAVWSAGYRMVLHFSSPDLYFNSADGRFFDVTPSRPITQPRIPGPLGPALGLQPDEAMQLGQDLNVMNNAPGYSISAQIFARDLNDDFHMILGVTTQNSNTGSRAQLLFHGSQMGTSSRVPDDSGSQLALDLVVPLTQWAHVRGQADFAGNNMLLEVNEERSLEDREFNDDHTSASPAGFVAIGANEDLATGFFNGVVDEIRLTEFARNFAWLDAERAALSPDFFSRMQ